jgi:hypothetical protein
MRIAQTQVTGVGTSPWLPLDHYTEGYGDGVFVNPGAGATVSVEVTPDDVFNPAVVPVAYPCGVASLTGATTKQAAALLYAAKAVRLNQTVGGSLSTLQVAVRGVG